ncbi:hypothetical protein [Brucella intermedia]|uniref:hypothetical protein n=1 Tax=Brucella intermedia TaxID=94625 RepID=UPI00124E465E|nr:hypothetical protein [Brucella intermedia]KAB2692405.1 hypothetical protein F9K72_21425 [Brucella intermedia]
MKKSDEPLFVTAPEFYWNIRWDCIFSHNELASVSDYAIDHVPAALTAIVTEFPFHSYGPLLVLAGTLAVLIETNIPGIYQSINYCLIASNTHHRETGATSISMLPKRNVSWIDFGKKIGEMDDLFAFRLSERLNVAVLKKSTIQSEHVVDGKYSAGFDNLIIKDCPFSIEICLDYDSTGYSQNVHAPSTESSKIDFLLACGMPLNKNHRYPRTVQYAVRNDGINKGLVEIHAVRNSQLDRAVPLFNSSRGIHLARLKID